MPHLLYPSLHWWTFTLFPCPGYCKEHGNELWGACLWITIFSGHMPRSGIAGSYVVLLLVSWGIFLLFFRLAVSVYIPTSSTGVFPFLHTLSSTHCLEIFFQHLLFVNFVIMTVPVHVRWYPVVLLICISPIISDVESLYMCLLSIFSCICMSSSKNVYLGLLLIFWLGCLLRYWAVWAVCIFSRLTWIWSVYLSTCHKVVDARKAGQPGRLG